jgi:hypothetical protein
MSSEPIPTPNQPIDTGRAERLMDALLVIDPKFRRYDQRQLKRAVEAFLFRLTVIRGLCE